MKVKASLMLILLLISPLCFAAINTVALWAYNETDQKQSVIMSSHKNSRGSCGDSSICANKKVPPYDTRVVAYDPTYGKIYVTVRHTHHFSERLTCASEDVVNNPIKPGHSYTIAISEVSHGKYICKIKQNF